MATFAAWCFRQAWQTDTAEDDKNYTAWRAEFEKDLSAEISAKEDLIRGLQEALAQRDDLDTKCRAHSATIADLENQLANVKRMYQSASDGNNEYLACLVERNDKIFQLEVQLQETEKLKAEKETLEKALFAVKAQTPVRKKGRK